MGIKVVNMMINYGILALVSFNDSKIDQPTSDPDLPRQYPPPSHNPYAPPGQRGGLVSRGRNGLFPCKVLMNDQ